MGKKRARSLSESNKTKSHHQPDAESVERTAAVRYSEEEPDAKKVKLLCRENVLVGLVRLKIWIYVDCRLSLRNF